MPFRLLLFTITAALLVLANPLAAQIVVPQGFTVRQIAPKLDDQIPQLEAVDDPDFGTGVVTAALSEDVVTLRIIYNTGTLEVLGNYVIDSGLPVDGIFHRVTKVALDRTRLIGGSIHFAVTYAKDGRAATDYAVLQRTGEILAKWTDDRNVAYTFSFFSNEANSSVAVVLFDGYLGDGTTLATMNANFTFNTVNPDSHPPGRTDLDIKKIAPETTGEYLGDLLLADSDPNHDDVSVIYGFTLQGESYAEITDVVSTSQRFYGDLAIAAGGVFGGVIYVTEQVTDEIQQVSPDGVHTTWASGFNGIDSLAISPDGNTMYVGDEDGVHLIRQGDVEPGPSVLCHSPSHPPASFLSGQEVTTFRVIFDEPVTFGQDDVSITNADGEDIPVAVSGSGSRFLIGGLGVPLFDDEYTSITLRDTIAAVETGNALDGDADGIEGGDYVFTLRHVAPDDPPVQSDQIPTLHASVTPFVDPEGGVVTYTYTWTSDGGDSPVVNGPTARTFDILTDGDGGSAFDPGERWTVTVTSEDASGQPGPTLTGVYIFGADTSTMTFEGWTIN